MFLKSPLEWFKPRFFYYLTFLISYITLFFITGLELYPVSSYILHTLFHFVFSIPLLFVHSYYCIRLLLFRKYYGLFILSAIILIFSSWVIAYYIYPQSGEERINFPFFISNRLLFFIIPTIIETVIQNNEIKKKYDNIQVMEQFLQLNQQIIPHLIFNSLTTLHHQIIIKSERAEQLSIKLSDLMEYSLNLSTNIWVTLENEINFLKSYIEFEKTSLENKQNIAFHTQYTNDKVSIPAMILIVFIENAFKHGNIRYNKEGFIEVIIVEEENQFFFQITNSKSENDSSKIKNKNIGLNNITKRLNLMYPDRYNLLINNEKDSYHVNLRLEHIKTAFL